MEIARADASSTEFFLFMIRAVLLFQEYSRGGQPRSGGQKLPFFSARLGAPVSPLESGVDKAP